jgi:hypothetical protein
MGLDGVQADVEHRGYRFVGLPFGQRLKYFALTVSKQPITLYDTPLFKNADVVLRQKFAPRSPGGSTAASPNPKPLHPNRLPESDAAPF